MRRGLLFVGTILLILLSVFPLWKGEKKGKRTENFHLRQRLRYETVLLFSMEKRQSLPLRTRVEWIVNVDGNKTEDGKFRISLGLGQCRAEANGKPLPKLCGIYRSPLNLLLDSEGKILAVETPDEASEKGKKLLAGLARSMEILHHNVEANVTETLGTLEAVFRHRGDGIERRYIRFVRVNAPWKEGKVQASNSLCRLAGDVPWCRQLESRDRFVLSNSWGIVTIDRNISLFLYGGDLPGNPPAVAIPVSKKSSETEKGLGEKEEREEGNPDTRTIMQRIRSSHESMGRKREWIMLLAKRASPEDQRALQDLILDDSAGRKLRFQAIFSLYELGKPPVEGLVDSLLQDALAKEDFGTLDAARLYALGGLAHRYPDEAISERLLDAYRDESDITKRAALIEALGNSRNAQALEEVEESLSAEAPFALKEALYSALRHGRGERSYRRLLRGLEIPKDATLYPEILESLQGYRIDEEGWKELGRFVEQRPLSYDATEALIELMASQKRNPLRSALIESLLKNPHYRRFTEKLFRLKALEKTGEPVNQDKKTPN